MIQPTQAPAVAIGSYYLRQMDPKNKTALFRGARIRSKKALRDARKAKDAMVEKVSEKTAGLKQSAGKIKDWVVDKTKGLLKNKTKTDVVSKAPKTPKQIAREAWKKRAPVDPSL
ncbi:MAG: hypothetical protein IKP65_05195 [Alphaproteobacteria bacterium]|nr:hypothetical protein [Alphaproteobacteria bacterium]